MGYNETYISEDISSVVIDGIVSFIAGLIPYATLFVLVVVLFFAIKVMNEATNQIFNIKKK